MAANERHPLIKLALDAIESFVKHKKVISPPGELTPEMEEKAGVFVCIKKGGELRGCIGTFIPTTGSVAEETIRNAIAAASEDPRFCTVDSCELDDIVCSVDVLTTPEPVKDLKTLDPKKYGVIVQSGYRKGLLLPDLDGVDTVGDQLSIAKAKAGIDRAEPVTVYRFMVKRYE